ncbi:MAG: beta-phosphoglucomutase, partial [Wenzhouxiangellaceae bacterium]|nr:beta-phosphoglucomutase [Wenzhouxiangellaceae bacterium]
PRIGVGAGAGMQWLQSESGDDLAWALQATPDDRLRVACGQRHLPYGDAFVHEGTERQQRRIVERFRGRIEPGRKLGLDKLVAWAWTDGSGKLRQDLERELDGAAGAGFETLRAQQEANLEPFWASAAAAVDGDPDAERALRFNLFHLFQSAARDGASGTAAKGLTGDGYEGHCFWDSEAFMLPVLALTAPDLALAALEFRHRTLDGARRHAREMNHARGALYPWRTIAGDECSGYYPSGSAQYHINAAIAWAIRFYVRATGDAGFLVRHGAEILFETARLWLEVGHFNANRSGAFCICEVTGPDEYSALVDNNFYTNRMARAHLLDAAAAWDRIHVEDPDAARALARTLALDESEVEQWRRAARAMYLPWDEALGIHAQDDGFLDKPVWDFANTPAAHYPLLLHYHPLTLYRHQVCKQADVVQALIMDGADIDRATKQRCFDYYQDVTTHDSTLSAGSFAILAAELDLPEAALAGFDETLNVDLDNLHGNTDHGAHMAAMAASWQCLAFGIAGLRLADEDLRVAPKLPARWRGWRLPLTWRGRRLRIDVDRDGAHYTLVDGAPMTLMHHDEQVALAPGRTETRRLPATAEWPLISGVRPIEALIFDLDGVLTDTAEAHYRAWQRLADELGIEFDRRVNRRLKGVDRMTSLDILLERASRGYDDDERAALAERKNGYYRESIRRITPRDLLPGAREALETARAAGARLGLASASRNAPALLDRLGIAGHFDFIADPARVGRGKPDPAIFLAAARGLGTDPAACLGIEDAAAGIAAIKAAGMTALGIGHRRDLPSADAVLDGLHQFRIETIPLAGSDGSESAHSAKRNR